uniref:Protein kinase domain-containing protein n=1 Tax=Parastrongyloides trichosuri TaxID=131310 RepID=A0A0N4ZMZ8_PARTI
MHVLPFSVTSENSSNPIIVTKFLKQGKFSAVYECERSKDVTPDCVIKFSFNESYDVEMDVLTTLQNLNVNMEKFHKLLYEGFYDKMDQHYFIYESVDMDLSDYINMQPNYKIDPREGLTIILELMKGISYLHECGFVYRNVRPSSFCLDYDRDNPEIINRVYIWELESCHRCSYVSYRYYVDLNQMKSIYDKRKRKNMNCAKYCAIREHAPDCEPKYSNDIESLYYMGVKMFEGTLPWSSIKNVEDNLIIEKKNLLRNPTIEFYRKTPILFTSIIGIIDKGFDTELDYNSIIKRMEKNIVQFETQDILSFDHEEEQFYQGVLKYRNEIIIPECEPKVRLPVKKVKSPLKKMSKFSMEVSTSSNKNEQDTTQKKRSIKSIFKGLFRKHKLLNRTKK